MDLNTRFNMPDEKIYYTLPPHYRGTYYYPYQIVEMNELIDDMRILINAENINDFLLLQESLILNELIIIYRLWLDSELSE